MKSFCPLRKDKGGRRQQTGERISSKLQPERGERDHKKIKVGSAVL